MAESRGMRDERTSIGVVIKSHKKYGSVSSNHVKRNESYVKHIVLPQDTLQGIALKYGATTEQIRRVNRIWTNDSLFLRKTLDIPVPKDSLDVFSFDNGDSSPVSSVCSGASEDSAQSCSHHQQVTSPLSEDDVQYPGSSEQTVADILVRIDSTIALTKSKVQKMESTQDCPVCRDDPDSIEQQLRGSSMQQRALMRASSDPNVAPHPLVMTQGRKVRSSLQRLEREQDELFEL